MGKEKQGTDPFTVAVAYETYKKLANDIVTAHRKLRSRQVELNLQMLFRPQNQKEVDEAIGKTVQATVELAVLGKSADDVLDIVYQAYVSQPNADDDTREILEALDAQRATQNNLISETKSFLSMMPKKYRPKKIKGS